MEMDAGDKARQAAQAIQDKKQDIPMAFPRIVQRTVAVSYRFQFVTALLPRRLAAVADRRYSAKANRKRYQPPFPHCLDLRPRVVCNALSRRRPLAGKLASRHGKGPHCSATGALLAQCIPARQPDAWHGQMALANARQQFSVIEVLPSSRRGGRRWLSWPSDNRPWPARWHMFRRRWVRCPFCEGVAQRLAAGLLPKS